VTFQRHGHEEKSADRPEAPCIQGNESAAGAEQNGISHSRYPPFSGFGDAKRGPDLDDRAGIGHRTDGPSESFLFGPFRLLTTQRALLEDERPVRLGSRALDILIALVARPGELLGKRELVQIVWPDTTVVEANLTVHVAALRRALGDGQAGNRYIVNSPGRGYRFIAPVTVSQDRTAATMRSEITVNPHNLPVQLTRLIGRADVIADIELRLSTQRLLTIVGPGGIGKTAVALEVAERKLGKFQEGIWLIDLSPIADPRLVPTALASSLKLEISSHDPLASLIAALQDKQMLLVLDNCEHLIAEAAALAAGLLRGVRNIHILATSREPLRLGGEQVCRLPPLESPPASAHPSAAEALVFPAIQLFAERAAATMNDFELSDADAASAADICRKLDGIPLAIEFAAARVDPFGVRGLATHLDDRLRLLGSGYRDAPSRHHTIRATLEWSYQLLGPEEQTVFRRLAIFVGGFTLESARAVMPEADRGLSDVAGTLTSLVMKSLVVADVGNGSVRFRLLETTRAYALTKLAEGAEAGFLSQRHATFYRDLLDTSRTGAIEDSASESKVEIDNIRAALTWSFGPSGDRSIAVSLAAASTSIWLETTLLMECRSWTSQALGILDDGDRGTRRELVLQTEFGLALMQTLGANSIARTALIRASELAERFQEPVYHLRAITGLATLCLRLEDPRGALALAERLEILAKATADPVATSTADVLFSAALICLAEDERAMSYAQRTLSRFQSVPRGRPSARTGIDPAIHARVIAASILMRQGLLDQSSLATLSVIDDAEAGGHAATLCYALAWCGCAIQLRTGDIDNAESSIARLRECSDKHILGSRLIKSTIQGLRPDRQRPNSFEPAGRSGLRYA
jgi:predicted ATPase/DNA-binding winged helix-turn-helix (wHTH) protein